MEGLWSSLTSEAQSKIIDYLQTGRRIRAIQVVRSDKSWESHNPLSNATVLDIIQFVRWIEIIKAEIT